MYIKNINLMFKKLIMAVAIAFTAFTANAATVNHLPKLEVIGITDLQKTGQKDIVVETTKDATTGVVEKRMVIRDDPGGSLKQFLEALQYAKNNNMKFKVDGMCASACTLILDKDRALDVCVTDNAVFGIHHPFLVQFNGITFDISYSIPAVIMADETWKNLFLKSYPDWVVQLIERNGGAPSVYEGNKPSDLFKVDSLLIGDRIKRCDQ